MRQFGKQHAADQWAKEQEEKGHKVLRTSQIDSDINLRGVAPNWSYCLQSNLYAAIGLIKRMNEEQTKIEELTVKQELHRAEHQKTSPHFALELFNAGRRIKALRRSYNKIVTNLTEI